MRFLITYGSYLAFPALAWAVVGLILRQGIALSLPIAITSLLVIWVRFIEPRILLVRRHKLDTGFMGKIALFSDLHIGMGKSGKRYFKRLVRVLNTLDVDAVCFAGDLFDDPLKVEVSEGQLMRLLKPFSELRRPLYMVLGDHDMLGSKEFHKKLSRVLQKIGINLLNNSCVTHGDLVFVGMAPDITRDQLSELWKKIPKTGKIISLMHNPDFTRWFPDLKVSLTLAGHTHGGQVRIPFIYKHVIPTKGDFDKDYSVEKNTKLFITAGVGESLLPVRFLVAPRVDVLELQ
jgi:predicted MPP superfamily phosphohydrolase